MNVSAAIESSLATMLQDLSDIETDVTFRPFQNLNYDGAWDENNDRVMPVVELRASPPSMAAEQITMSITTIILVATQNADDRDHRCLRENYTAVQSCLDRLYSQWRNLDTGGAEYTSFFTSMNDFVESGKFQFGGFTFDDPQIPFEDRGANVIGISLTTHYSREDF